MSNKRTGGKIIFTALHINNFLYAQTDFGCQKKARLISDPHIIYKYGKLIVCLFTFGAVLMFKNNKHQIKVGENLEHTPV